MPKLWLHTEIQRTFCLFDRPALDGVGIDHGSTNTIMKQEFLCRYFDNHNAIFVVNEILNGIIRCINDKKHIITCYAVNLGIP